MRRNSVSSSNRGWTFRSRASPASSTAWMRALSSAGERVGASATMRSRRSRLIRRSSSPVCCQTRMSRYQYSAISRSSGRSSLSLENSSAASRRSSGSAPSSRSSRSRIRSRRCCVSSDVTQRTARPSSPPDSAATKRARPFGTPCRSTRARSIAGAGMRENLTSWHRDTTVGSSGTVDSAMRMITTRSGGSSSTLSRLLAASVVMVSASART